MGGMETLATAIAKAVEKSKKGRPAERGVITGGNVQIGTRLYPCKLAVDLNIQDGDVVWCQLTDNETLAVIVGA